MLCPLEHRGSWKNRSCGRNESPTFLSLHIISHNTDFIENVMSSSNPIASCIFFAAGTCLSSCYLGRGVFSGFTIPEFRNSADTQLLRPKGDLIRLILFFQNMESRLKSIWKVVCVHTTPTWLNRRTSDGPLLARQ
jgi:hypothetical protein